MNEEVDKCVTHERVIYRPLFYDDRSYTSWGFQNYDLALNLWCYRGTWFV